MKSAQMARITTIGLLLMVAAPLVEAQDVVASSFDQLHLAFRLGDTVTVTDTAGRRITGKVANLSPSALTLIVDRTRRDLPESDVTRIVRTHNHPGAGAKWGLIAGAAVGATTGAIIGSCGGPDCGAGAWALAEGAFFGAIGAGIGAGVGAMTMTHDLIYQKPGSSAPRVTLSPLVTRERKGVALSLGF